MTLTLAVLSIAPLFELTRYANSVTSNRNSTAQRGGRLYPKLTIAGAEHDSMPISRIIMDALPHQAVHVGDDLGDLRPVFLEKRGGGKPTKEARAVAMRHAEASARRSCADVDAYLSNLRALFDLHDDLLLGRFDY